MNIGHWTSPKLENMQTEALLSIEGSCLWAWGLRYADKPESRCTVSFYFVFVFVFALVCLRFMFVLVFVVLVQTVSCLWAWGTRYADKPRSRCSSRPIARRPDKPTCLVASEPNAKFDSFIWDFQQQQHRYMYSSSCLPFPMSGPKGIMSPVLLRWPDVQTSQRLASLQGSSSLKLKTSSPTSVHKLQVVYMRVPPRSDQPVWDQLKCHLGICDGETCQGL